MQLSPYLVFNGACAEAFTAYRSIFGAPEPVLFRLRDMPGERPPGPDDAVMHGELVLGATTLTGADDIMGNSPVMAGASVLVTLDTTAESRRVFGALAAGGEVRMPFEATFWSAGFGTLTDRWGIRWMISTTQERNE